MCVIMITNFLELAITLKYLGAKWLLEKKVNFTPWPTIESFYGLDRQSSKIIRVCIEVCNLCKAPIWTCSTENSSTWHGSLSVISVQMFRFFTLINIKTCSSTLTFLQWAIQYIPAPFFHMGWAWSFRYENESCGHALGCQVK